MVPDPVVLFTSEIILKLPLQLIFWLRKGAEMHYIPNLSRHPTEWIREGQLF